MGQGDKPTAIEALRTLQLHEARWQAILDSARDAIIGIDPNGRVTLFNRGAEAIFGYASVEVVGRHVAMLMPPPYREQHDAYLESYRATGVPKAALSCAKRPSAVRLRADAVGSYGSTSTM